MESEAEKLDFAYKYPFSKAAMEIIGSASSKVEEKYLRLGKLRLEEDLGRRRPEFTSRMLSRRPFISSLDLSMTIISLAGGLMLSMYLLLPENRCRGNRGE